MIQEFPTTIHYKLIRTKEFYKDDHNEDMVFVHAMLVEIQYPKGSVQKREKSLFSTFKRFPIQEEYVYFFTKKIPYGTSGYDLTKNELENLLKVLETDQDYLFKYSP